MIEDFAELSRGARKGRRRHRALGREGRRRLARRGHGLVQRCRQPRDAGAEGSARAHFFNHQTHHRGQAHAMLTAAGQETGDTDLFLLIPEIVD